MTLILAPSIVAAPSFTSSLVPKHAYHGKLKFRLACTLGPTTMRFPLLARVVLPRTGRSTHAWGGACLSLERPHDGVVSYCPISPTPDAAASWWPCPHAMQICICTCTWHQADQAAACKPTATLSSMNLGVCSAAQGCAGQVLRRGCEPQEEAAEEAGRGQEAHEGVWQGGGAPGGLCQRALHGQGAVATCACTWS